ncbi:hypothetical protein ACIHEI_35130 [Kitasatospora sp. NPDC051984]|uniref:hypothetical protein n=1 Tax=Kitasatospora sp. NPDC051984 TaxID=3364059 RepID=UPI0037CAB246
MLRLLDQFPDVDAVFAASDAMAVGALRALRRLGRHHPAAARHPVPPHHRPRPPPSPATTRPHSTGPAPPCAKRSHLIAERLTDAHEETGGGPLPAEVVDKIVASAIAEVRVRARLECRPPSWRRARSRTASPPKPGAGTCAPAATRSPSSAQRGHRAVAPAAGGVSHFALGTWLDNRKAGRAELASGRLARLVGLGVGWAWAGCRFCRVLLAGLAMCGVGRQCPVGLLVGQRRGLGGRPRA